MRKRRKKVLLIGGRSKAISLATSLINQGYKVTAINDDYNDCLRLAEIKGLDVIYGDGTKPHYLEEATASTCNIAIALTGKDEDNLVACQLCKRVYNVDKTVSLLGDPNKIDFYSSLGVDSTVCAVSMVTNIVQQQALIDDMTNIIPISQGRVQIIEIQINGNSPAMNKKLWEVNFPKDCIVGCVLRGDNTIIPRGDTRILVGDTLVILTVSGQEMMVANLLTGN